MAGMVQEEGSSSVTSSPLQIFSLMSISPSLGSPYPWLRELKSEDRGLYLIQLLLSCANHVAAGSLDNANLCLEQISLLASPDGDSMQRMSAYFTEALAGRILKSWPGLYKALNSTKISSLSESILVRRLFFELCPFLKLAYVVSNQAILEAMEGEKMIHIIDLNCGEPAPWIALIQALSARPEGPPHLRITGIHEQKVVLEQAALRLTEEAEKLDIPFQFNPVVSKLENLDMESLRVKTGEALAISSVLQMHSLLSGEDEGHRKMTPPKTPNSSHLHRVLHLNQSTLGELLEKELINGHSPSHDSGSSAPFSAKMESFLSSLLGLSPKIMVVTEQESNHNGSTLMDRLLEALYFYAALFDCLESTMPRASMERLKIEKMLFGEEIKNIIACEGIERKERHEKLEKWIQRFDMIGYGRVALSYYGMLQAKRLLQSYGCDGYKIKEENGALVICWQDRALFSVSAWRCRRFVMTQNMPDDEIQIPIEDSADIWNEDGSIESCSHDVFDQSDLNRVWEQRQNQFHRIGYRDGLLTGKEMSAQEGFNVGFKQSVEMVEKVEARDKLQRLYEFVSSISTGDAIKLFHQDLMQSESEQSQDSQQQEAENDDTGNKPDQILRCSQLINFSSDLELLLVELPKIKVHETIGRTVGTRRM
ncbi:hypothetical protein H6P81_014971 [Aristolochia fimbriata]|uniref:Essential protein Yae1 N-terminal domain-containing protein n=1 Tax=Aristolochia fimbriata TaxID=158543 RepID=A0AAV7E5G7_ARIFI|nr:hypothetical protein H6P81_014971 [Aristolochia fimbriata]